MDRNAVVNKISSWVGCVQGDATHKHIVDTYNKFVDSKYNEGRKYHLKYNDSWCAGTVTAAYFESGNIAVFPCGECSCCKIIELAQKHGLWVENDDYRPTIADVIIYAWDDDKDWEHQDNTTGHDHTGIVVQVCADYFIVVEGNKGDNHVCGSRKVKFNGKNIRGFVTPNFDDEKVYYTVKKGDTLSKIGKQFNVPWQSIATLNNIKAPYTIYPNQVLRIK